MAHEHAPWRKLVLIPCWTFQLFFLLVEIIILAASVSSLGTLQKNVDTGALGKATHIGLVLWLSVCSIILVLSIAEIGMLEVHLLRPLIFIIMNTFKTTLWTVLFMIDMVSITKGKPGTMALVGVGIESILLVSLWIPFIYGWVIYYRCRKEQKFNRQTLSEHLLNSSYPPKDPQGTVELGERYDDIPVVPDGAENSRIGRYKQGDSSFDSYR